MSRRGVCFSSDGSKLANCSHDKSVKIWSVITVCVDERSGVDFFHAPHIISTIGTAGERIGVGCKNGEVLQLRAHWLV
jgi:hypothetical protein